MNNILRIGYPLRNDKILYNSIRYPNLNMLNTIVWYNINTTFDFHIYISREILIIARLHDNFFIFGRT